MYLSKVRLTNWRSYQDEVFEFPKPTDRRPLVLVGAMNGHGKTSFLIALYVGMFGRFGVRYCEGLTNQAEEDSVWYRKIIKMYRRNTASSDEPSSIEIVFSPTKHDKNFDDEVKIIRRWHFSSSGVPKLGDQFEELHLYVADKLIRLSDVDAGKNRIEKSLFPPHVMPAFFFDGEQAQTLITNSGAPGIKKAVEVMYGTKVLEEVHAEVGQFISQSHGVIGGKRATTELEAALQNNLDKREAINKLIGTRQVTEAELSKDREQIDREEKSVQERLARLGGVTADLTLLNSKLKEAQKRKYDAQRSFEASISQLGLGMAIKRLRLALTNRLDAEEKREKWESLMSGTIERTDQVLQIALPEPPATDILLGHLPSELRDQVKSRFRTALEHIYDPPPIGCASEYLHAHAMGEQRRELRKCMELFSIDNESQLKRRVKDYEDASIELKDAEESIEKFNNLPKEVEQLQTEFKKLHQDLSDVLRRLHAVENEVKQLKADLQNLNQEIGAQQEKLAKLKPEQKRIAVAERVNRVVEALLESLKPMAIRSLEKSVSEHFVNVLDSRFKGSKVKMSSDETPMLIRSKDESQPIETMSGFERRSFGVAFSMALVALTQRRLPLVIDTPLGNADSDYRPRLLKALTETDLDQIIILSHDEEVNGRILDEIDDKVAKKYLVKYDQETKTSRVFPGQYF